MITEFFSINNIFFTVMGYQMSYLEFFGTILNIASVWLVARNNIWTWPVGNVAVVLFGALFYQIQLYSDLLEQVYYLITGFWGWYLWIQYNNRKEEDKNLRITHNTRSGNINSVLIIALGTAALGYFISRIHIYLPAYFPEAASFPYLDAFTTVMSFVAQILMAYKKIESWLLWIAVDIIGIWLYWVKDAKFVSILYLIFLVLATKGLLNWLEEHKKSVEIS